MTEGMFVTLSQRAPRTQTSDSDARIRDHVKSTCRFVRGSTPHFPEIGKHELLGEAQSARASVVTRASSFKLNAEEGR